MTRLRRIPPVLDACCGGRMFWYDKHDARAVFIDNRTVEPVLLSNGATFEVRPDELADFRSMPFPARTFSLVVFDPPHIARAGAKSFMGTKYGYLDAATWRADLRAGFAECFRVLKRRGVLVFKWNECHIPVQEVLQLAPYPPLFGNRSGRASKTHWIVFMRP